MCGQSGTFTLNEKSDLTVDFVEQHLYQGSKLSVYPAADFTFVQRLAYDIHVDYIFMVEETGPITKNIANQTIIQDQQTKLHGIHGDIVKT